MSLIDRMSDYFGLRESELARLIKSAPLRYKVYRIPKKREGEFRIIAQPSKEVKALQYWMIDNMLKDLPVHPCALAYKKGASIKKNALAHSNNNFLLKVDFADFFPSIKPEDLWAYLERNHPNSFTQEDFNFASYILFWSPKHVRKGGLQLSIGAPSSPLISNLVMFDFDCEAAKVAMEYEAQYTRYADDLAFSTNKPYSLNKIYESIENICKGLTHPKLTINTSKTVFSSKKNRRRITGLIVTNEGNVSLGRERKRMIRTTIDHYGKGKLSTEQKLNLQGLLAFAIDVEPNFIETMEKKYSKELIDSILHP